MNLVDLDTFARVAATGSFTAAAKALGVPKSTVSRRVSKLEDALGVALFKRTGRAVALTPTGERLYERTSGPLREVEDVERELRDGAGEPAGVLRLTAPPDIGAAPWLVRMLTRYRDRHPGVTLHVELTNRVVDLLAESFDLALRPQGVGSSAALVARRLLPVAGTHAGFLVGLYAAPSYLARRGAPAELAEVADHDAIVHGPTARGGFWTLSHLDERTDRVRPSAVIVANDFNFVVQAVLDGAGIGLLPGLTAMPLARAGAIVPVLPEWGLAMGGLHVVWPASRHLSARVRAFVDHAVEYVAGLDCHDWDQSFGALRPPPVGDPAPRP